MSSLTERFAALPEDLQDWLVVNHDALQGTRYSVCTRGGHGTPIGCLYLYYLTGPREWTELARVKSRLEAAEAMAAHQERMEADNASTTDVR